MKLRYWLLIGVAVVITAPGTGAEEIGGLPDHLVAALGLIELGRLLGDLAGELGVRHDAAREGHVARGAHAPVVAAGPPPTIIVSTSWPPTVTERARRVNCVVSSSVWCDTLRGMCRQTTCRTCGRPGWAGCGAHVEQVLGHVPQNERCQCGSDAASSGRKGWFRR